MEVITQFAEKLMGDRLKKEDGEIVIKYYNPDFEFIIFKDKRNIKNPNVIVIDKRKIKHVVYNNVRVAMNMITL